MNYPVPAASGPLPAQADTIDTMDPAAGGAGANPLVTVHRLLRGRYKWAIMLGLILAVAGATAGWKLPKPTYRSGAWLQVKAKHPDILWPAEAIQMFGGYVLEQVNTLRSRRVVDMAMADSRWREIDPEIDDADIAAFQQNLGVGYNAKNGPFIEVAFADPDRKVAQTAVKVVLDAYFRVYREKEAAKAGNDLATMQSAQAGQESKIKQLRARITNVAAPFGTDELTETYQAKMRLRDHFEEQLRLINVELGVTDEATAENFSEPAMPLTPREIAERDGYMRSLLMRKQQLEMDLRAMENSLGSQHRNVRLQRMAIEQQEHEIERYARDYRHGIVPGSTLDAPLAVGGGTVNRREELLQRRQSLIENLDAVKTEVQQIGQAKFAIDGYRAEMDRLSKDLGFVNRRIEMKQFEERFGGYVEALNEPDLPVSPHNDKRVKLAAAGGVAGMAMGFGVFLLIGLLDRSFRNSEDARVGVGPVRMLGVLPSLPPDLADPQQATIAAYCVHHIRTLLQIVTDGRQRQVLAITSPASGTGKTSLTLSLGLSFAASGARTLLIDCDLVGGGLSSRVNAIVRRKIGQILLQRGLIDQEQLDEALHASGPDKRIGEVLVERGVVSPEDLAEALTIQDENHVGLMDALDGEPFEHCITSMGTDRLSILPIGTAHGHHATKVSPVALQRLLEQARKHYDIVLIDTGPVPGSIEASMVAAQVDEVILTVSRGEQRAAAERAVEHLHDVGARVAGLVFNRADTEDVERSASMSMVSYQSKYTSNGSTPRVSPGNDPEARRRLGPVATAVAAQGPGAGSGPSA